MVMNNENVEGNGGVLTFLGGKEENHGKQKAGYSPSGLRFEPAACEIEIGSVINAPNVLSSQ
jgi:hypothetical protein